MPKSTTIETFYFSQIVFIIFSEMILLLTYVKILNSIIVSSLHLCFSSLSIIYIHRNNIRMNNTTCFDTKKMLLKISSNINCTLKGLRILISCFSPCFWSQTFNEIMNLILFTHTFYFVHN